MTPLANRLSVHILTDLNTHCPRTILAIDSWLDHVGFWLADLSCHPRTKDQLPFMMSLLAINLAKTLGCSIQEARQLLKDEMVIQQAERMVA